MVLQVPRDIMAANAAIDYVVFSDVMFSCHLRKLPCMPCYANSLDKTDCQMYTLDVDF